MSKNGLPVPIPPSLRERMQSVRWLATLGKDAVDELVLEGELVRFSAGRRLIGELELGDSMFVILDGTATATVRAGQAEPNVIGTLGPGDSCGEIALLTRELRSATVTATTEVDALRIDRDEIEAFLRKHPSVAVHFAREIAARLIQTDAALDELLSGGPSERASSLSGIHPAVTPMRGSLSRAWRELVETRRRELPFIALTGFLVALVSIRVLVRLTELAGANLFDLLRVAYTGGIALVILSASLSFVRFSSRVRRAVATAYGMGFALIFNELSVFLAFDTFYLDMTTRDPALKFSVEALYRRSEGDWAVVLALAVLLQATYLRRFYRRSVFILTTRLRTLLSRG
jgi:CRP-like cAMP-binding protein